MTRVLRPPLPADIGVAAFDDLHDHPPAWRDLMQSLADEHTGTREPEALQQVREGTVLVALLGDTRVLKLYPPFLRDHFEFEQAALARLGGLLSVPTPRLLATGERDGWPYLLMSQLHGQPLTAVWPGLTEAQKCALLRTLGALVAEVHALPVGALARQAPPWAGFIAAQRLKCFARQQRTGLPVHLLAQLEGFLAGPLPGEPPDAAAPDVILTGEYTPMNLLYADGGLSGLYDFGDGMVGPREYDWLGPLCFLAAGHAARCRAFFDGYGTAPDAAGRQALLRLLLLHRYSHLPLQIAMKDWQRAESLEALAPLIWPL